CQLTLTGVYTTLRRLFALQPLLSKTLLRPDSSDPIRRLPITRWPDDQIARCLQMVSSLPVCGRTETNAKRDPWLLGLTETICWLPSVPTFNSTASPPLLFPQETGLETSSLPALESTSLQAPWHWMGLPYFCRSLL